MAGGAGTLDPLGPDAPAGTAGPDSSAGPAGPDGSRRMQDDGRFARADVVANLHEQTLRRPNLTGVKWSFSGAVAMSKPIL